MTGATRSRVPFRYKAAAIVVTLAFLSLIHPAKQLIAHERAVLLRGWGSLPLPDLVESVRGALPSAVDDASLRRRTARHLQEETTPEAEVSEAVPDDADDELCSSAIAELPAEARCQHVEVRGGCLAAWV